ETQPRPGMNVLSSGLQGMTPPTFWAGRHRWVSRLNAIPDGHAGINSSLRHRPPSAVAGGQIQVREPLGAMRREQPARFCAEATLFWAKIPSTTISAANMLLLTECIGASPGKIRSVQADATEGKRAPRMLLQ